MKRLFFLLCLANLIFALWHFHIGRLTFETENSVSPSPILLVSEYRRARRGTDIARIVDQDIDRWRADDIRWMLADLEKEKWELKPAPSPAVKKDDKPAKTTKAFEPPKPVIRAAEKKCFEAGPFSDETGVKAWLTENALKANEVIQKDIDVPSDYQVYYPAAKTPEQSRINKLMLNAKGLEDVWQISSGDIKGSYSLGVFREKQRALTFKSQLTEKGIKAEIRQREKSLPQWFARIQLEQAKTKQYVSPGLNLTPCSAD
ncbi:hypothetical protein [Methylomonas sp. MgM2]